jgi:hypothetical protein
MSHKYSASDLKLNLGNSENSGEHTRRLLQEYRNVLSQYMPTTLNTPPVRQSINRPSISQSDTVLPSTPTNFQNFTSPIISSFQSTNYAMESPSLSESNYPSREQIDARSTSVPYVINIIAITQLDTKIHLKHHRTDKMIRLLVIMRKLETYKTDYSTYNEKD